MATLMRRLLAQTFHPSRPAAAPSDYGHRGAANVRRDINHADCRAWAADRVGTRARESRTVARDFAYAALDGGACAATWLPTARTAVSAGYHAAARPIIRARIMRAGARRGTLPDLALGR